MSDLQISDNELDQIMRVFDWFQEKDDELLEHIFSHFTNEKIGGEILKSVVKIEDSRQQELFGEISRELVQIMSDEILHCLSITSDTKEEAEEKVQWISEKFRRKASLVVGSVLHHI